MLDQDFVRAQFPAFSEASLQGQAFFENAGGSYACRQVIDRLTRFYTERKVQPYAPYRASTLGGEEMDEARTRLSAVLGVAPDELSFGPSTTANTYVLSQAFASFMGHGGSIVVTNQDHEANTGPWRRLAERGIEVREWRMDPETGHLNPDDLDDLLDETTRLVCFPHCSNVIGEINPVAEIAAKVRAAGAVTCVDGVSYAPHGLPDVKALGSDIYLFSAYKTYGPHQGIMTIRKGLAEVLPNQGHVFNGYDTSKRFTPAGPDHAQVAACAGMVDYLDALATHHGLADAQAVHHAMRQTEEVRMGPLMDYLTARNDVRVLGPQTPGNRAPTLALELEDPAGKAVALAEHGIMCGAGDFYAVRALEASGVNPDPGVLRLSFTHYTSAAEITQLMTALDQVL